MADEARKLSEEEVYQCLKSLNVPVRLTDLKTPTKEFMIRVFECCLKDLHVDVGTLSLRPFETLDRMEHTDLFEDTRTLMLLVIGINFILTPDGLTISFKDVVDPKPKRTKKILTFLIIFWNVYLRKIANFQAIEDSLQDVRRQSEELARRNDILREKIVDASAILNELRPLKDELQSCVCSKSDKLTENDNQKIEITDEYQNLKKKENDLQTQLSTVEVGIVVAKERICELDQLILSSPEKLDKDLRRMKDVIREEELKVREKELELREKKKSLEATTIAQDENAKTLNGLEEMEIGLKEMCDTVKSISLELQQYRGEKDRMQKLQSELGTKQQIESFHMQKSSAFHLNTKKKKESFVKTIETLQGNITDEKMRLKLATAANSEIDQKCDEVSDSIEIISNTYKQAQAISAGKDTEFGDQIERIISAFQSDSETLKDDLMKKFGA